MFTFKSTRWLILAVILLGFFLRLALAEATLDLRIFADEKDYTRLARGILDSPLTYDNVFRPPAYPMLLAASYAAFGSGRFPTAVTNALLAALNIALVYTLAQTLFQRRAVAVLSALGLAVGLEFIALTRLYLADNLFFALSTLGFWLLLKFYRAPIAPRLFVVGAVFAVAALTREIIGLFVLVCVPAWMLLALAPRWRHASTNALWVVLGMLLVLTPWVIRNYGIEARFILISTSGEFNFARDNVREEKKVGLESTIPKNEPTMSHMFKELAAVSPPQRGAYAFQRGLAVIRHNPVLWFLVKTHRLDSALTPDVLKQPYVRLQTLSAEMRARWTQLNGIYLYAVLLLALVGLLTARENAPKLLILLYLVFSTAVFIVTHYQPRYRLPLLILFFPYAAFGLVYLTQALRAAIHALRGRAATRAWHSRPQ
jgi:4-amino-4-deoxy-L-arabinose transferase-like glycosyltransferase